VPQAKYKPVTPIVKAIIINKSSIMMRFEGIISAENANPPATIIEAKPIRRA
jgi:hypothetical protein